MPNLLAKLLEAENAFSEVVAALAALDEMDLSASDLELTERLHDVAYDAMVDLANRRMAVGG